MLRRFAEAYAIAFPLLSDKASAVIRRFGIANMNAPEGTRYYGVPFPGAYLLGPDGSVREKFFLPDYQTRPAASGVLLTRLGGVVGAPSMVIDTDGMRATVTLSDRKSYSGQELGVSVDFDIPAPWHIYGEPLPAGYQPTALRFDGEPIAAQWIALPAPEQLTIQALGETLPVYSGRVSGRGGILLKRIAPGDHVLRGSLSFQRCSDSECLAPQSVNFELPLKIEPMVGPAAKP